MAKKQTTKKNSKWLKISLLSLLGLVTVYLAGSFVYNSYLDQVDRNRWLTVREDIEELSRQLTTNTGSEWSFKAGCGEGSAKFQKPLIGCDASIVNSTPVNSIDEVKKIVDEYSNQFKTYDKLKFIPKADYSIYPNEGVGLDINSSDNRLKYVGYGGGSFVHVNFSGVVCDDAYEITHEKGNPRQALLESVFRCGGNARKLYY